MVAHVGEFSGVEEVFRAFCLFGTGSAPPPKVLEMDSLRWTKLCRECGLLLEYATAEDRADARAKVRQRTGKVRTRTKKLEGPPGGVDARELRSSGQGVLEQAILTLAQAQNQQTQLLGQQLKSMAEAQAQAVQAQQQQATMMGLQLANLTETQAQTSQLLVALIWGPQQTGKRFSQDGVRLKREPRRRKTASLRHLSTEQSVARSEAVTSEDNEGSDSS
jgi:hypothetical protein